MNELDTKTWTQITGEQLVGTFEKIPNEKPDEKPGKNPKENPEEQFEVQLFERAKEKPEEKAEENTEEQLERKPDEKLEENPEEKQGKNIEAEIPYEREDYAVTNKHRKIRVEKDKDHFDDWIQFFYPKQHRAHILTDIDIISRHQSVERIFTLFMVLAFLLALVASAEIVFGVYLLNGSENSLIVLNISTKQTKNNRFPILHFAMISKNGSIFDVSATESVSASQGLLIKLQTSLYSGYSDPDGVLYVFQRDLKRPMVKYHKSFNKRGYVNVALKTSPPDMQKFYAHGIEINSVFIFAFLMHSWKSDDRTQNGNSKVKFICFQPICTTNCN